MTSGSSIMSARPMASVLSATPGPLGEALADRALLARRVARVEPEDESEREEVLGTLHVLGGQAHPLAGERHQLVEVDLDDAVALHRAVGERVRLPAGARQVCRR